MRRDQRRRSSRNFPAVANEFMKRLCEVKDELHFPVVEAGDAATVRAWNSLQCPKGQQHCDKSQRCEGMRGQNLLTIASIEDKLFAKGFVHVNEEQPVEPGVSWKRSRRKGDF